MVAISAVDYMHALRLVGFTNEQSEVQARELERVVVAITKEREELKHDLKKELELEGLATKKDVEAVKQEIEKLASKKDLELAIEKVRYDALKFTVWTGVSVIVVLGGMLAKGFHWF